MKVLLVAIATLIMFSTNLQAQQTTFYDGQINAAIAKISAIEAAYPGSEVLTILCDTSETGTQTLFYKRLCPAGSPNHAASVSVQFTLNSTSASTKFCDGPPNASQEIVFDQPERDLAAAGRELKSICRELPFDSAPVCN